jgi:cytochrome c1
MRFTAIHDSQGTIAALVVSPPGAPPAQLQTQPGQRMTEVEAPEVTVDLAGLRLNEDLSDLMQTHRVESQTEQGKLTRKPD